MKAMTPAERIASVDYETRELMIAENQSGCGMKHIAIKYRVSEATVRVIIHDSKLDGRSRRAVVLREPPVWDAVIEPGWQCHGELTAAESRLYPNV